MIKVLRGQRRRGATGAAKGARSTYGSEDITVLKSVWLVAGQPCGKRMAGEMLRIWLASWQKHHGTLSGEQIGRLAAISPAQIDRVLAPYRNAGRRRRIASSALAAMQREVAVRCDPWAETAPGALEIDTVALCGGSMSGAIVWALDASDIHSAVGPRCVPCGIAAVIPRASDSARSRPRCPSCCASWTSTTAPSF